MTDPANPNKIFPGVPETNRGFQYPASGLNNTAEYMASGLPYSSGVLITAGAASRVDFPFVTSEIYITNSGSAAAFGWTANGVLGTNRHVLAANSSIALRIRVNTIYFTSLGAAGSLSLTAALTTIPFRSYPKLTGSNADPVTGEPLFLSASVDRSYGYGGLG